MSLTLDDSVERNLEPTITVSKEHVKNLINELADMLYVDPGVKISHDLGDLHPLTQLAVLFDCD